MNIEEINRRFNEQLEQQINGTLLKGHVYQLGRASLILQSAEIDDLPIEMWSGRLEAKSKQENHPFDLKDIKNLPLVVQNPMAVFRSKTVPGRKVIMVDLVDKNGINFVVIMSVNATQGYGKNTHQINDICNVYPKDNIRDIIRWINRGDLLVMADKTKLGGWITQQQPYAADLEIHPSELVVATKIIQDFNNPKLPEKKIIKKTTVVPNYKKGRGI